MSGPRWRAALLLLAVLLPLGTGLALRYGTPAPTLQQTVGDATITFTAARGAVWLVAFLAGIALAVTVGYGGWGGICATPTIIYCRNINQF